jgi:hypothetical protein
MKMRQLGDSDLHISPIGLGTWAIGGDLSFGWGPQDGAESIAAIQLSSDTRSSDRGRTSTIPRILKTAPYPLAQSVHTLTERRGQ